MHNDIKWYRKDCDWVPMGYIPAGAFAAIGTLFTFGLVPVVFSVLIILPLVIHGILHLTSASRGMVETEFTVWKQYQNLPEGYKETINLTPKYIKSLPLGTEWTELKNNVSELSTLIAQQNQSKGMNAELRSAFSAAISAEKSKLEHEREVNSVLRERGWGS